MRVELPAHVRRALYELRQAGRVLLVTHHDADGVSSAGVLYRALYTLGKDVDILLLRQYYPDTLGRIPYTDYDYVVFSDLAGSYVESIEGVLGEKFFIIDHHDTNIVTSPRVFHPAQLGYSPDTEASSSTLAALSAYNMVKDPKILAYGLVGAAGDNQIIEGRFEGLNRVFVVRALKEKVLTVYRDFVLPGSGVKSIYWLLLNSDPPLPGLTGEEEAVYDLLERAGVDPAAHYVDLDIERRRNLFTLLALHLLRHGWTSKELRTLIGEVYEINGNIGWTQTVRGMKSLANAVGKLLHEEIIGPLFLDDVSVLPEAEEILYKYRSMMSDAIRTGREATEDMGGFVFVDGRGRIPEFLAGTVASVLAAERGRPVLVITDAEDGYVKGSLRGSEGLSYLVKVLAEKIGVEGGGHSGAAGFRAREEDIEEILALLSEEFESSG